MLISAMNFKINGKIIVGVNELRCQTYKFMLCNIQGYSK